MATLIGSPTEPLTLEGVAKISQTLAEDLQRVVFSTDGFTVEDYFSLDGNYLVEYVEGRLQILPMPDFFHQAIIGWFYITLMRLFASDPDARVSMAPAKIMLDAQRYREPDICVMLGQNKHRRNRKYWVGADFVLEVMSESNRDHDWTTKRTDYAKAGIPEYWIVDPDQRTVTRLVLKDGIYAEEITAREGESLASIILDGFVVDIAQLFREAEANA
jgi:Uma2 family endonuclease